MDKIYLTLGIKISYNKHIIKSIILFCALHNNSYGESNESSTLHSNNFYVGGGLGAGINFFSPTSHQIEVANPAHASFAWRLFGGYNLNKNFAFELGYTNFGYYENFGSGNSICDTKGVCGYPNANIGDGVFDTQINVNNQIQAYAIDLTVIGKYNVTDNFNLFGRAGANYMNAQLNSTVIVNPKVPVPNTNIGPSITQYSNATNNTQFLPIVGLGYEYNPNKLIGIRFEYDYYFGSEMINQDNINQGKLYPSAILLSTVFNL